MRGIDDDRVDRSVRKVSGNIGEGRTSRQTVDGPKEMPRLARRVDVEAGEGDVSRVAGRVAPRHIDVGDEAARQRRRRRPRAAAVEGGPGGKAARAVDVGGNRDAPVGRAHVDYLFAA